MPGLTNEEEERETPQPHLKPKIKEIAKLIERDGFVDKIEEQISALSGKLSKKYEHIENDLHGNRGAVKKIRELLNMTTGKAHSWMRSFLHLAAHFDLIPGDDLVDLAEKVDEPKSEEEPGISAADMAPKSGDVVEHPSRENAIDRHKQRLKDGDKPPPGEPVTDNRDLADAGDSVRAEIEEQRRQDAEAFDAQTQPAA